MKKFLIIVCVIGVIVFLGYIGKDMNLSNLNSNKTNTATNSNVITGKNNTANNTSTNANKTVNNTTNNTNETVKENTTNTANTTENKIVNNTTNTTNETNTANNTKTTIEEVATSDEDKAIDLAKKTYGSTDGVNFKIEQIEDNGVYIISVRDAETTSALVWYNVNVKTGAVN